MYKYNFNLDNQSLEVNLEGEVIKLYPGTFDDSEYNGVDITRYCTEENFYFFHIKDLRINEIPNNHSFMVHLRDSWSENYDNRELPFFKMFEVIPTVYNYITFIKIDNRLKVRVEFLGYTINWPSRWSFEEYGKGLKQSLNKKNDNVFISKEDYDPGNLFYNLYYEYDDDNSTTLEEALKNCITEINRRHMKTEETLLGLSIYQDRLQFWEKNKQNSDEEAWQKEFQEFPWILSNSMSLPVFLFQGKAYIGGKNIENKTGNVIDFLFKNNMINNLTLIEIKTPETPLMSTSKYRGNFYINNELSGSITQILKYKETILKSYYSLRAESSSDFNVFNPKIILVIGNKSTLNDDQLESFEIFRNELRNVEIITFDELYENLEVLHGLVSDGLINR